MKKYTLFLFSLVLVLGFFINFNSARADYLPGCTSEQGNSTTTGNPCNLYFTVGCTSEQGYSPTTGEKCYSMMLPPGCLSSDSYSLTTGVKCDSWFSSPNLPVGCTSTEGYSLITGVKCDSGVTPPTTSLPVGCTSTRGYSPITGVKCDSSTPVTPIYPPGCTSDQGFSPTTGQSCGSPTSPAPVISSVSGPQSLNVNQEGRWSVQAYDRNGGNLTYAVNWGDMYSTDILKGNSVIQSQSQSATFTHTYPRAGVYTPTFTVTNNIVCITAPCPNSASASLSVNVGGVAGFSIDLTSRGIETKPDNYTVDYRVTFDGNRFEPLGVTLELSCSPEAVTWTYIGGKSDVVCTNRSDNNSGIDMQAVADGDYRATIVFHNSGSFKQPVVAVAKAWGGNRTVISTDRDTITLPASGGTTQPSITVLSPNGGEKYRVGDKVNIKWESKDIVATDIAKIELGYTHTDPTYGAGTYFEDLIAEKTSNTGSYSWVIPEYYATGAVTSSFTVKVTVAGISDYSNGKFSIVSPLKRGGINVTSPISGAGYYNGDTAKISWVSTGKDQYVVSLLKKSDPSFLRISLDTQGTSPNLTWKIPNDIPIGYDYFLKVSEGLYRNKTGYSPLFAIKPNTNQAFIDLQVNGSDNPPAVEYESVVEASWGSTGLDISKTECVMGGHNVQTTDGRLWTDLRDQEPNGVIKLYAKHATYGYVSPLTLTITCFDGTKNYTDTISVPVKEPNTQSSITVLSPNGGEKWQKGTTETIKWRDTNNISTHEIKLVPYFPPCVTGRPCSIPAYPYVSSYTIANTQGSSYRWPVGQTWENPSVPDGMYTIQVCQTGSTNCDSSNNYFTITSSITTNHAPIIQGPFLSNATTAVGQIADFNFRATDADNDNLSWGVEWGDSNIGTAQTCPRNPPVGTGQNWNYSTSHAWNTAGIYTVNVNVNDCKGGSDSESFTVNVGNTTTPSITSITPSSGPVGTSVTIYGNNLANTSSNGSSNYIWFNSYSFGATNASADGRSVSFAVPSYLAPGTYQVAVKTSLSLAASNSFLFTITPSTAQPLAATCQGSTNTSRLEATWNASASGGSGAYNYQWSFYNDVTSYGAVSAPYTRIVQYGSSGTKEAVARVSDGVTVVNANCSTTLGIVTPTTQPSLTLSAKQMVTNDGQPITYNITWSSTNANSCTLTTNATKESEDFDFWSGYVGPIALSGTITADVTKNTTVTINCTGTDGSTISKSVTVTVTSTTSNVLGAESFHFTQFLEQGSRGNEVIELQKFLNGAGFDAGNVDGVFGTKVKEAVIKLQTDNKLKADGIVGYEVRSFLNR